MTASQLDRRALGRTLSRLANATVDEVLAMTQPADADALARRIGFTGPPGAGKSSLIGRLAIRRAATRLIGVLAIDPSSPRSGGAILGDRIRMDELVGVEGIYVRSIASRSAGDGLSENIPELLHALDHAGFDEVIVETVGVGQVAHAVRHQVDTLVLVLTPESGDTVQAMKAGIIEIADVFVINKADLPGAPRLAGEITSVLQLSKSCGWTPTVLTASSRDPDSIERICAAIDAHQAWLRSSGTDGERRVQRAVYRLRSLLERRLAETCAKLDRKFLARPLAVQAGEIARQLQASLPDPQARSPGLQAHVADTGTGTDRRADADTTHDEQLRPTGMTTRGTP